MRYLAAETGADAGADYGTILDAERRVVQLTRELERLTPAVAVYDAEYGAEYGSEYSEGHGGAPDAATVCASLPEAATLLEYFADGDTLIAFVLTRSGVRAQTLGSPSQIESELGRLNFFLTRAAQGQRYLEVYGEAGLQARIDKHLGTLFDLLIRPLELTHPNSDSGFNSSSDAELNVSPKFDLTVVPHGPLQAVPFTALFSGAHYLIDDAHLSVAPSAAVYLHCRNRPQHPAAGLVAFGVPTESIPGVENEITAIAELAQLGRGAKTFVGEAATLSAFFTRAPHASILHLATHGVYRPDHPAFSGLRLIDGWLTARDLYTLELRAALVVLSACESALSGQGVGDEQFGLARGFLHAGAPALVASLWPVKDDQTTLLVRAFYKRLYGGESVGRALRGAQLEVRRSHPNPYYWAAFTVIGDPERTVVDAQISTPG